MLGWLIVCTTNSINMKPIFWEITQKQTKHFFPVDYYIYSEVLALLQTLQSSALLFHWDLD